MRASEITNDNLLDYLKLDELEDLTIYFESALDFIKNYTGLSYEELDLIPSIVPAIYVLVAEYYENRSFSVSNEKVNAVINSTLDMYRKNLL